ncbi:MAG: hypothetical protein ACI90V_009914 [Bacillariaceae sp.]|jgi:hypothetical protein
MTQKSQKKTPKKNLKSKSSTSSETSVAKKNIRQTANGKAKKMKNTTHKTKSVMTAAKKSRGAKKSPENDKKPAAIKSTKDSKNKKKDVKNDLVESKSTQLQKEKTKRQLKQKQQEKQSDDTNCSDNSSDSEEEEEEAACFMCHCGLDCSDRALFFPKDRKSELEEDEDYYFGLDDPYLDGDKFYDRNNALVYCDTCNRLYHQKCHFVPLLVVPRGDFHCLICSIQQQQTAQDKQTPSKKRKRKNAVNGTKAPAIQEKIFNRKITDQIFQNPPQLLETEDVQSFQKEWERDSATYKALLWERQLKQLKTFLKSQASNIRMANTTLSTMTSTKRNRQHFLESSKFGGRSSQEVAQTLCKLTGAKFKIREAFLSLESIRTSNEAIDYSSLFSFCQEYPQHAEHVFPSGSNLCRDGRRIVPRTGERKPSIVEEGKQGPTKCKNNKDSSIIPNEITVNNNNTGKRSTRSKSPPKASSAVTKSSKASALSKRGEKEKDSMRSTTKSAHIDVNPENDGDDDDDDDDSGISLDDLKCSVCMIGDCSDENDVILCDGKDCHRAFHMKCVCPIVKSEDIENEDEDWFCPICESIANFMGEMHDLCIGNDDDDDDAASSGSWEDIHDIFPNSQWEYETAMKILKGKRNEDTQRLMAMFLGEDTTNKSQVQMPVGSDSEDENDYSLFDEDSFEERRRKEKDDDDSDSDDSTCSVEFMVGKDELGALSEDDNESSEETSDDESETKIRKSRRLVKRKEVMEESNNADFGADFCESNIINGKRKRKRVNYRKLNDMMFGDLSDNQQVIIDGGDDFDASKIKATKTESDNDSDDDEQDDDNGSKGDEQDDDSGSKEGEQDDDSGSKDYEQDDDGGSKDDEQDNGGSS